MVVQNVYLYSLLLSIRGAGITTYGRLVIIGSYPVPSTTVRAAARLPTSVARDIELLTLLPMLTEH